MKQLREKTLHFISSLEGYHQVLKEIHWSTTCNAEHKLVDEIDEEVLEYEDKIAEVTMGKLNTRYGIGDINTLLPSGKTLVAVLKEMEEDVDELKNAYGDDVKYSGVQNVLDDFKEDINSWNYKRTLT